MTFDELITDMQNVPFSELRKKYDGYFEFVLFTQNLIRLYPVLESFFGLPFKPAGIAPSREALDVAERYGGIQKNQTLYFKKDGVAAQCAMIWPWSDGAHVTVKVAQGTVPEKK